MQIKMAFGPVLVSISITHSRATEQLQRAAPVMEQLFYGGLVTLLVLIDIKNQ